MQFLTIRTSGRMLAICTWIFLSGIAGCRKNDDAKANAFHFDGDTRDLQSALLFYAPSPESADDGTLYYRNIFILLSTGLATDEHTMSGRGNAIELSIYGASQDLDEGTYTFTEPKAAAKAFGILAGTVQLEDADALQMFSFTSAEMTVTRSERNYFIDIAGVVNGKILKAHFQGTMTTLQNK